MVRCLVTESNTRPLLPHTQLPSHLVIVSLVIVVIETLAVRRCRDWVPNLMLGKVKVVRRRGDGHQSHIKAGRRKNEVSLT